MGAPSRPFSPALRHRCRPVRSAPGDPPPRGDPDPDTPVQPPDQGATPRTRARNGEIRKSGDGGQISKNAGYSAPSPAPLVAGMRAGNASPSRPRERPGWGRECEWKSAAFRKSRVFPAWREGAALPGVQTHSSPVTVRTAHHESGTRPLPAACPSPPASRQGDLQSHDLRRGGKERFRHGYAENIP